MSADQTQPLPELGPSSSGPPGEKPPSRPRALMIALGVGAVVVIAGLVAALVLVMSGDSETTQAEPSAGLDPEYATAVTAPVKRLSESAQVTGRVLSQASRARDVARVGRMARQQLAVVQGARARIADIPSGADSRTAAGALSRATQAHRTYLTSLSRLPTVETQRAIASLGPARRQARRALAQYRLFSRQVPGLVGGITTAGMADLSGVRQALNAKRRQEEAEQEEQRQEQQGNGGGGSPSGGGSSYERPVVSSVSAVDAGGWIEVSANYCDRTPGAVNDFIYSFRLQRGGSTLAEDGYPASQTRACNTISTSFSDTFPLGSYEVVVVVDNLTNNVSGSASASLSVVD